MAYDYQTERPALFTDDGQRKFLVVRDRMNKMLEESGAVMHGCLRLIGDSWFHFACCDRLIELGEIVQINDKSVAGMHRVYVKPGTAASGSSG